MLGHTGQQLWRYEKRPAGWGPALDFLNNQLCTGNTIKYNLVYDIYGEGIDNHNGTTEYNVVGDTYSVAIYVAPHEQAAGADTIVRYNFVMSSSSADYRVLDGRTGYNGIGILDEDALGDNSSGAFQIYGNIVINRYQGIYVKNAHVATGGAFASIKIYNNLIIYWADY